MTDRFHEPPPGATPLEEDDLTGLRLDWITTRSELDEAESATTSVGRQATAEGHNIGVDLVRIPVEMQMVCDKVIAQIGDGASLISAGQPRARYLTALPKADRHDYADLIAFAQSY